MEDDSIGGARGTGDLFAPASSAAAGIERPSPAAAQRPRPAPTETRPPETALQPRQAGPSKGLVQEVEFANAIAEFLNQKVSFQYDERIAQIVVKVTRENSDEVIRQIPTEEMIKLIAKFRQDFRGLIFDRSG